MKKPKFKVISVGEKLFLIERSAVGPVKTFAGQSMLFTEDKPLDPFDSEEEATAAMEKYILECTQGGGPDRGGEDVPEIEEKDFVVAVSIHKEIKVKAADKKDAIEQLKKLPFGDHIGWENATPRQV